jgi:hypothetical protein
VDGATVLLALRFRSSKELESYNVLSLLLMLGTALKREGIKLQEHGNQSEEFTHNCERNKWGIYTQRNGSSIPSNRLRACSEPFLSTKLGRRHELVHQSERENQIETRMLEGTRT